MKFGICLLPGVGHYPDPTVVARDAEDRGFDMLFMPENSHVPIERRRPVPYDDARMKSLSRFLDPFVALAAAAAVTERIQLGISVCLLTQRDAVPAARSAASLDRLSGGRLILGVAGGFVAEAMANHGTEFKRRWQCVRERTEAIRSLWRDPHPEYHGDFVDFGPLDHGFTPHTLEGPPIFIGSNSGKVPGRVASYADGWLAMNGRYAGNPVADLRAECERRGREPSAVRCMLMDAPQDERGIAAARETGYDGVIFMVRATAGRACLAPLDGLARLREALAA